MNEAVVFREAFDSITLLSLWTDREGGRLLHEKPSEARFYYVQASIPFDTAVLLSSPSIFLAAAKQPLELKIREFAAEHEPAAVYDHPFTGWVDADGVTFRVDHDRGSYMAYFGIPMPLFVAEHAAREEAAEARRAAGVK